MGHVCDSRCTLVRREALLICAATGAVARDESLGTPAGAAPAPGWRRSVARYATPELLQKAVEKTVSRVLRGATPEQICYYSGRVAIVYAQLVDAMGRMASATGTGKAAEKLQLDATSAVLLRYMAEGVERSSGTWLFEPDPALDALLICYSDIRRLIGESINRTSHLTGNYLRWNEDTLRVS